MDRFEEKGHEWLLRCRTIEEVDRQKAFSCKCCMRTPRFTWKDCDKCPINMTAEFLVSYFADEIQRKAKAQKGGEK